MKEKSMPMIIPFKTTKECFNTLKNLYEKKALIQKRKLKKNIRNLEMEKDQKMAYCLTKISQVIDRLMEFGDKIEDDHLVQTIFNGLLVTWETFLAIVNIREAQQSFDRLWHDCLEEEGRIQSRYGPPTEKVHALVSKAKKGKIFPQHKDNGKGP